MSKWRLAALVLLGFVLCGTGLVAAPAHAAPDPSAGALFRWEMPPRFGAERDDRGLLVETQPWQVRRGPWTVVLDVSARACAEGNHYRWTISGTHTVPRRIGDCRFSFMEPREGRHTVTLEATTPRANLVEAQRVDVRDWLIVSIGDSVASGEGVPEADGMWQSARCHRSALSGTALAARKIERDDAHSSVTFVHLACSGAEVPQGLLGPYDGAVPPGEEPPLTPQVDELDRIAQRRKVDAVLLSIGANDIHFSEFLNFCLGHPFGDCFRHTYTKVGGDGEKSAEAVAKDFLAELPGRYADLARALSGPIPANRVHIVEYFDPTRDAKGRPCGRLIGDIFKANVIRAETLLLDPLNQAVATAARQHEWDEVTGVAGLFRTHGICAGKQAWVSSLPDSLLKLRGLAGRHRGAMHPNEAGHEATSRLIASSLERDLRVEPSPTSEPSGSNGPVDNGQGSGGDSGDDTLGTAALLVLTVLAALAIAFALGPLPLLLLLLGVSWESGAPILVGLLLATLLLLRPRNVRHLLRPFRALARTLRPLLLPLMVIVAVGTVKWSATAQILITAALIVLAWRLIVVPEAGRASVNLAFESDLAKKIAKHAAVAIVAGLLAVAAFRGLVLPSTAYFKTIGDAASGLLLLGLVLWLAAIVLRLISHATSGLRAAIATLIGLCLLIPAMALGLMPWGGDLGDAWPSLLGILAACTLLLLLAEAIRYALSNPSEATEEQQELDPPQTLTGRIRGLGFSAAASAAVVLAIATGWGMIDAADKGQPLNPPEEDSALAATTATTAPASDLDLAKRYAPVLAFTKGERWTPVRVEPYVARAQLSGPAGTPAKLTDYGAVSSCPQSRSWCYTLSIECPNGDEDCAHAVHREPTARDRETLHEEGAVYVRVVDRDALPLAHRKAVFADGGPFGERLTKLVQYWYWYEYDQWEAPVFAGLLTQRHEGDWEAVTLGLENDRRPLFLAYSAHCGGSWRRWREVEASTLPAGPRVHPLVAVAEGSHANYPAADQKRSPNWATCAGLPAGVTDAIGFASNIRDRTEYAWPWYPSPQGWIEVGANTPPMNFKGSWGADDRMTLRNFKANQLGEPGHGPLSPPLQALWREPVPLIFCGKYTPKECAAK